MKILAIDSSAKVAAAAICTEEQILAETTINTKLTHSQTLMPVCKGLLDNAKIAIEELDGFAISAGPGSFTGLRIGMAAVSEHLPYPHMSCTAAMRGIYSRLRS